MLKTQVYPNSGSYTHSLGCKTAGVICKFRQVQTMANDYPYTGAGRGRGRGRGSSSSARGRGNGRGRGPAHKEQLSSHEVSMFKEWAAERSRERSKEEKRAEKLAHRKSSAKMVAKFAKLNNLKEIKYNLSDSSSSDDDSSSSEEETKEQSKKAKKRKKKKKERLKRAREKQEADEARIKYLEEQLEKEKHNGVGGKKVKARESPRSTTTNKSIVTSAKGLANKCKAAINKAGGNSSAFKLPYEDDVDIEFENFKDMSIAIDMMIETAMEKTKKQPEKKKTTIKFDKKELSKTLSQQKGKTRRRLGTIPEEDDSMQDTASDDDSDESRKGNDSCSVLDYSLPAEAGVDTLLGYLEKDATLRIKAKKVSSKNFNECYVKAVNGQMRALVKGPLSHAKQKVKALIKKLKLEKYTNKGIDKATVPEMVTIILCVIKALPDRD